MKKIIIFFALMAAAVFGAQQAKAATDLGGIFYNLDAENGTAEVTKMPSGKYTGDIVIPASVNDGTKDYDVTSIGNEAFFNCPGLTGITFPATLTTISTYAFYGCTGLKNVTIPNSVTSLGSRAFFGCTSLQSITLSNQIPSIASETFRQCASLTEISIPASITSIANYAFDECPSLTAINVAAENTEFCSAEGVLFNKDKTKLIVYPGAKAGVYSIPNTVTTLGTGAFYGCVGLTSITIPASVINISKEVFQGCTSLTSMVVENGNPNFDSRNNCNAIITTATNTLLSGCKTTIIPEDIEKIGFYAFCGCTGLTSISIPNSVKILDYYCFEDCHGLTTISIPNSVETINSSAFYGCKGLTSIEIPDNVTSMGRWGFRYCTNLKNVTFGNGLTTIDEAMFQGCSALEQVTIGSAVAEIKGYAFDGCSQLKSITCKSVTPPTISGDNTFRYVPATTLVYVPCEAGDAYTDANWGGFSNIENKTMFDVQATAVANGSVAINATADCNKVRITATPDEGYEFDQWSNGLTDAEIILVVTSDITISATFKQKTFGVTFKGWKDGVTDAVLKEEVVAYGSAATAPEVPEREGWKFKAWDKAFDNITADVVVTALYEENTTTGIDGILESSDSQTVKITRNGQLLIIHNGRTYNAQGAVVK